MVKSGRTDLAVMAERLLLAFAIVILLTPLAAASPGDGDVVAEGSLRLVGDVSGRLGDDGGFALVSPAGASIQGTADHVKVTLDGIKKTRVTSPLGAPVDRNEGLQEETFEADGASVELDDVREGAYILVFSDGGSGRFELDGAELRGFEQRTVVPVPFDVAEDDGDYFHFSPRDVITADATSGSYAAAGSLKMFIWNADVVIAGRHFETGVLESETTGPLPGDSVRETRYVWAIVEIQGAMLDIAGDHAVVADALGYDLDGRLTAGRADVDFVVDGVDRTAQDAAFALRGVVTVAPERVAGAGQTRACDISTSDGTAPCSESDAATAANVRGEILEITAGAVRVRDPDTLAAGAAGGVALLAFIGWALYTRLTSPVLLDNDVRAEIYRIVCEAPGIGAREVHRRSGRSWGTVVYHLRQLERHSLVKSRAMGRLRNYYENHGKWAGQENKLAALKGDRTIQIAKAIAETPGIHQELLVQATGLPQSTVSYRIKRLREAGLIEERRDARFASYHPTEDLVRLLEVRGAETAEAPDADAADGAPAA